MAGPGIEPGTSDTSVRHATDCARTDSVPGGATYVFVLLSLLRNIVMRMGREKRMYFSF